MGNKPTLPEVIPLMRAYAAKEGNECGGSLHVVLDDGNVNDSHVKFCIQYAKDNNDPGGVKLGETLLSMSKTQRRELANMFYD